MTKEFLVKGSSEEPYVVTFSKDGSNITARCTCQAGRFGNQCKHRINILHGDSSAVVSNNVNEVDEVAAWLEGSDIAAALDTIVRLEKEKAKITREISKAKKIVADVMAKEAI